MVQHASEWGQGTSIHMENKSAHWLQYSFPLCLPPWTHTVEPENRSKTQLAGSLFADWSAQNRQFWGRNRRQSESSRTNKRTTEGTAHQDTGIELSSRIAVGLQHSQLRLAAQNAASCYGYAWSHHSQSAHHCCFTTCSWHREGYCFIDLHAYVHALGEEPAIPGSFSPGPFGLENTSPVQCLPHSGLGRFSAWHTVTSYCGGIRFILKSCISINCLTSLPYLCSKGTARLPKSSPFEHYFPSVCFNPQTCIWYEKKKNHSKEAKLSYYIIFI